MRDDTTFDYFVRIKQSESVNLLHTVL